MNTYPFEIHVTIDSRASDPLLPFETVLVFKKVCEAETLTPLFIDLIRDRKMIGIDMLTSSKFVGITADAKREAVRITKAMEAAHLKVVRFKVEAPGWANKDVHENWSLSGDYFESHIDVRLGTTFAAQDESLKRLDAFCKHGRGLFLSMNPAKKYKPNPEMILTYRRKCSRAEFAEELHGVLNRLDLDGFDYTRKAVTTEYAVFDSNLAHDNEWTGANHGR